MTTLAPRIDPAAVGLTDAEYHEIIRRLGREPSGLEMQLFGVMWSEHCSYKHSRSNLRMLPVEGARVLGGPGENAGVMDIGGGWAVAFKMESHNHPSAVDPYNGAATGVGGIIRDVLAMGARPIALLDSLHFGPLHEPSVRRIASGVIAGIAGYGNCIGVPTVGGEILVDSRYRGNPLVNVACLGLVRLDQLAHARATGPGNLVMYVGARTGRDGIGGAAFASEELHEGSAREDRSSVQLGDPFTGKLLIEATLEAIEDGGVVALQDMGAAGLTCAAAELAARGGVGMSLDLDRVPLRERGMAPDEILRSESQERMLLIVRPERADQVASVFRKWGLLASVIGEVTASPELRVIHQGAAVVAMPSQALTDAPERRPVSSAPPALSAQWTWSPHILSGHDVDPGKALLAMLGAPDIGSKRSVFEQYDHAVQVRTVLPPGAGDAAVLRLHEMSPRGLALAVDGNGRLCALDPYRGGKLAVAECAANLACVGAEPIGVTDCLNFGSPEDPEVFWMFEESVRGIADACRALRIPVVGGNVSFYNESPEGPIPPTPVVAIAGLVDDVSRAPGMALAAGDLIALIGPQMARLDASTFLYEVHGMSAGRPSDVDLDLHQRVLSVVRQAARAGILHAAHDAAEGGVAVALAECVVAGGVGADIELPAESSRDAAPSQDVTLSRDAALFGEAPSRFIVSFSPAAAAHLQSLAAKWDVPVVMVGRTTPDRTDAEPRLRIRIADTVAIDLSLAELSRAYESLSEVLG